MFLGNRGELKRAQMVNDLYDELFGRADQVRPVAPPSLEALIEWVKEHRDRAESATEYAWLDASLENLETVRRGR